MRMLSRSPCSDSSDTEESRFPPYFVFFALSCPLPWFLNHRKGEGDDFGGLKLKRRGLNWMRRHFSPLPSQSPGTGASPQLLPCPALPNADASAHPVFPAQKPFTTPGRSSGKGCLPGTLCTAGPHSCSSPYPSVTLLLTSWQWALFQNCLSLRCLHMEELGNPRSHTRLLFWSHILSQTNGLKSGGVHLCSNFSFIQLICRSDGCRFKCPHSSLLACGSKASQSPSTSQTTQETKQYIISESQDKVSSSSRSDLQRAREIALVFSFLYRRPEDRPVKIFKHTPKSRWTE